MTRFRYPLRTLLLDDAKAVAGLAISAGPLFLDDLLRFWLYIFLLLTQFQSYEDYKAVNYTFCNFREKSLGN